jgi:hypothetical protein
VVKGGRRPTPRQRRLALDRREHGGTLGALGTHEGDRSTHNLKAIFGLIAGRLELKLPT